MVRTEKPGTLVTAYATRDETIALGHRLSGNGGFAVMSVAYEKPAPAGQWGGHGEAVAHVLVVEGSRCPCCWRKIETLSLPGDPA